jgi:hypothetical protein
MRESLMYGSVRGARGNSRPYRDAPAQSWCDPAGERSYAGVADEVVPVRFLSTISRIGETNGSPPGEHCVRHNQ